MSVIVDRNALTESDKKAIATQLTVSIEKGRKSKLEQLQCYTVDSETVRIPLHYAANILDYTNDDINHFRKDVAFTGCLRSHQKVLIDEGLKRLAEERAYSLIASTGAGKTVMGVWYSCRLSCITCILIHRKTLIPQWVKTIQTFTNGSYWIVDNEPPEVLPNFIICMNLRTEKIPEYIRKEISLFIIDEAHNMCTRKNFIRIMDFNPIYLIAMTATCNRPDNGYEIINKFSGTNYVRYSSDKAIDVIRVNTPFNWSRVVNEKTGEVDWTVIESELHYSTGRNNMLLNLVASNLDRKIMIFTGRVEHVDLLYEALSYYNVKCDYMKGNKKSYSDSNVLIGTTSKIGTGFDEATFCPDFSGKHIDMIIIYNSYKSLIQLEQNIGRSRSDFPVIYHFVDKDKIIYRHWLELRKFYLDEGSAVKATLYTIEGEVGDWIWPYDEEGNWILEDE